MNILLNGTLKKNESFKSPGRLNVEMVSSSESMSCNWRLNKAVHEGFVCSIFVSAVCFVCFVSVFFTVWFDLRASGGFQGCVCYGPLGSGVERLR